MNWSSLEEGLLSQDLGRLKLYQIKLKPRSEGDALNPLLTVVHKV